jgi:hypothetical protein
MNPAAILLQHADELKLTPEQKAKLEEFAKGPVSVLTDEQRAKAGAWLPPPPGAPSGGGPGRPDGNQAGGPPIPPPGAPQDGSQAGGAPRCPPLGAPKQDAPSDNTKK